MSTVLHRAIALTARAARKSVILLALYIVAVEAAGLHAAIAPVAAIVILLSLVAVFLGAINKAASMLIDDLALLAVLLASYGASKGLIAFNVEAPGYTTTIKIHTVAYFLLGLGYIAVSMAGHIVEALETLRKNEKS